MRHGHPALLFWILIVIGCCTESFSQGKLYTARGYWEETKKKEYLEIKEKQIKGDSLTENEKNYLQDYDTYLATYFQRLPEDQKQDFEKFRVYWDTGSAAPSDTNQIEPGYEWRGRDRLSNGLYGIWYGASLSAVTQASGSAATGISLITGGLWMLGPAINPKKYEGLTHSIVRASNTGKFLGLIYGGAMGLAISGVSDERSKWAFGLSTVGSISLGEIGFQMQKKKKFTDGQIEMIRHYGFLGPWIGFAGYYSTGSTNSNATGAAILGGGIAGLTIGNAVSKKYDYTVGDVDAISSLTLITTGLGFTGVIESLRTSSTASPSIILIPAASSIIGTVWGQRSIRGAHLTDRQGSTLNLSTAGAGLFGLGVVSLINPTDAPAAYVGVPSVLALVTHQILLHNFKAKNLQLNLRGSRNEKSNFKLAVQVTPENYLFHQKISYRDTQQTAFSLQQNPIFRIKLTF